MKVFSFFL